jgi:hypothetical protein
VLADSHGQTQLLAKAPKRNADPKSESVQEGNGNAGDGARDNALKILDNAPLQSVVQVNGVVKRRIASAVTPVRPSISLPLLFFVSSFCLFSRARSTLNSQPSTLDPSEAALILFPTLALYLFWLHSPFSIINYYPLVFH